MKKLLPTIALFITSYLLVSCSFTHNIDKVAEECLGFELDKVYTITQDVFLVKAYSKAYRDYKTKEIIIEESRSGIALTPESSYKQCGRLFSAPESIQKYKDDPTKSVMIDIYWAIPVIGVVEEGTNIKISKIEKSVGYSWWFGFGSGVSNYGEILNGKYSGKEVIVDDLGKIYTCKHTDSVERAPDPNFLILKED